MIKQCFVELDEFDVAEPNILNYGHTFGHALESASRFTIPHGIAVTLGMDLANFVAGSLHLTPLALFDGRHPIHLRNAGDLAARCVEFERFVKALRSDKKNAGRRGQDDSS